MKSWVATKSSNFYVNHLDKYLGEDDETPTKLIERIKEEIRQKSIKKSKATYKGKKRGARKRQ